MSTHERATFIAQYDWAQNPGQLPWAHDEPTLFLADICQIRPPGRALDMGCGSGTDSVFLARQGWQVTALDFVPKALEYTRARAAAAGAELETVEADITTWEVTGRFDLVLDHGLLHNMDPARHAAYRERALAALAPDGDFVILHWLRRTPDEPRQGRVGPRRASRDEIRDFFGPELHERFFAVEEYEDLPPMVGGSMAQAVLWLRRSRAETRSAGLLAEVRQTLEAQGIDVDPLLAAPPVGPEADEALARLAGPGRLGLTHRRPAAAVAAAALAAWAGRTGQDAAAARALLTVFGSAAATNFCGETPRCLECGVSACRRWRPPPTRA